MLDPVRPALLALLVLGPAGCGPGPPDPCASGPGYARDVAPIVAARCLGCHSAGLLGDARRGAPEGLDLDDPDLAEPWFEGIADAIASGTMPPSEGAPLTTREERATAIDWRACGLPR
jgi:uncharacterized membrane protein